MDWFASYRVYIVIVTWVFNTIVTAFVGAFSAPTKESSLFYQWWFVFSNSVIGNIKRAQATHVENSPNFVDAVKTQLNGQTTEQLQEQLDKLKLTPKV